MAQRLQQQLKEVGSKLESPPASKDALIKLLKQAANCLSEIEQSPIPSVLDSMQSCLNAIAKKELLTHQDRDVKVLVATCVCEITRITAPEAPYSDDVLKDIFHLVVGTFAGLGDINSPSFGRRVVILETLAKYRSCVVMLDLECHDLIHEMFRTFFSVICDAHPQNILTSMQTIMVLILDESEDIQENLITTILSALGRKTNCSVAARRLAMKIIEHSAGKLEPYIKQFLVSSLSGDSSYLNNSIDHHEVIYDIYQSAPQILTGIIPYITGELLADKIDVRLKAVQLLGDLFSLSEVPIYEAFNPIFAEYLKRLSDRVVEVRLSVIEHLKNCLISKSSCPEAPQIIRALADRVLDYDETVRKKVVAAVYDVTCHSLTAIPPEIACLVAERLRDKSLTVKKYTLERLVDLHRLYCLKYSDGSTNIEDCKWIPGKILRCLYDRDFRLDTIELILCGSLFPPEFSVNNRVKHWVSIFSVFDKFEVKALEQILVQKQRLQQEMQRYLSLRQTYQEDASELQKNFFGCFKSMSRLFNDPMKAEENFQLLHHLKDTNVWKILTMLLDPSTSLHQAWASRDDLLRILGEKHPLFDFMSILSLKCSYLLFNKEYVKEILSEVDAKHAVGDMKLLSSCMNLLTVIACYSPLLLAGCEDLIRLLKEDNELIKEGIAHVLAKAGGTIREQLLMATSSVELLLERLCLEGTRKQAKYSVLALAAITKDDGLKSLSVLYKRLVDMLEEKTHLAAILQSLGCIAQTAMPIFETREDEITEFITEKILKCSNADEVSLDKAEWSERSELCLIKIFGIKSLVKSYLPAKDAHLRPGIEKLLDILKNILSYGEISVGVRSSDVDKAHMRLASAKAVLRLSRHWEQKIPANLFYLTLRISQASYPQSRKSFLNKVHQYIKERLLDAKYSCAFLLSINDCRNPEYEECKQTLFELIQICHQFKVRQLSAQSDGNPVATYPEYILAYVVHVLAHDPSCPNVDECMDVQAFEPTYWRLNLFLSLLLHGDDGYQSGAFLNRRKESYKAVFSIFHSIKHSEDVVDEAKSNIIHAICDLGLSIAKRLVPEEAKVSGLDAVSLPTMLYRAVERSEEENATDENKKTWLSSDSALAHFEALRIENKEKGDSGAVVDGMSLEENDGGENELPLGKMIEMLRSQGRKKKKKMKKDSELSNLENIENEFDVLGVVREINLDNLKRVETETGKLVPDLESESAKVADKRNEKEFESPKRKREGTGIEVIVPTPKRKRSISKNRSNLAKGQKGNIMISSPQSFAKDNMIHSLKERSSSEKDMDDNTTTDLLVTFSPGITSKQGKNVSDGLHVGKDVDNTPEKLALREDIGKKVDQSKSSSTKKRKRRSISVIEKCSSQSNQFGDADLVGCRIKIWWPLDKRFYEGVVHAYESGKKKHTIVYDDGDVEVLHLGKEKWEVVSRTQIPEKHAKSRGPSGFKDVSPESLTDKNNHSFPGQSKKSRKKSSSSKASKKATTKKHIGKNSKQVFVDSKADPSVDSRVDSDISDSYQNSDLDFKSYDHKENEVSPASDMQEKPHARLKELDKSSKEESVGLSDGHDDSDDEPINAWRLRVVKST